ncbi:amidase [Nocardioides sp.]|uniref:amidase n=1 Tax=Nocardioides sp. TaxID=35761 RepID=UPI0027335D74|nr:amidase family protein [Nocardioides sp.]MDP3894240.1 amidase family protein [Nocardioides sp.]
MKGKTVHELVRKTAYEVVDLLRRGDVSPVELVKVLEEHVATADADVNALPIRFFEHAAARAEALAKRHPEPRERGPLAGLPVAVKDYNDVAGQVTTFGSPIFANAIASQSDAMVKVLEGNGAIPYAKSNVPEFAGGHTYNTLFGPSRNPWDLTRSVGGSSGGAAASLAAGSAWLATGNDLGGSLRTPAGFNGVVGIRPTPGRVPRRRPAVPFDTLWVEGPMARNVTDAALMLDAMVGYDPHDALTAHPQPSSFLAQLDRHEVPTRIAYSADLGVLPVDPTVRNVARDSLRHFVDLGIDVVDTCPDFSDAYEAFQALRAHLIATIHASTLEQHRDLIKPDIVWNIEKGLGQSLSLVQWAERARGELVHRMADLFADVDILVVPSAPLPPFPVEWESPRVVDGVELDSYIDWIAITFCISLTGSPVVALPCGLSSEGLPIGVQLVGRPGGESALLSHARRFEAAVGIASSLPVTPGRRAPSVR